METQTAILDKLVEQKHEQNDQQHAISPRKLNKSLSPDLMQQQEVQQNQALIKLHKSHSSKTQMVQDIHSILNITGQKMTYNL